MLAQLFWLILGLSLLAFGGGSAIIPDLQREVVQVRGWLSARQFVDFYALTQITPGPSMLIVSLIGFQVAGGAGALVAYAAMFGPSTLLVLSIKPVWKRLRESRYQETLRRSTRPFAVATVLASACLVALDNNQQSLHWGLSFFATAAIGSGRLGILPTMATCAALSFMVVG